MLALAACSVRGKFKCKLIHIKMPVAYSNDLRWRIVWLNVFMEIRAEDVAKLMYVSERTVYRYVDRYRATGEVRPSLKRNGPVKLLSEHEELLLTQLILAYPGIYLRELQQHLYNATGRWVAASTVCRTVHHLGMTRQRIKHLSIRQSEIKRAEFWAEMTAFNTEMLLWVDESGCDRRNALRKYGYGIRGQPPQDRSLILRGKRFSAIGILSTQGVEDVYITDGAVDSETFLDFVRRDMLPILMPFNGQNPNSVVIMDNASIHHVDEVVELITSCGALVRFLPPYPPDMNPIEEVFAEIKLYLQANSSLFESSLSVASILLVAFNSVTVQNCHAYIQHSGYIL